MPENSGLIQQPSEESGGAVMDPIQHPTDSASSSRTNSEINLPIVTETLATSSEFGGNTVKTSNSCPDFRSTNSQQEGTCLRKRTYSTSSSPIELRERCNEQPYRDWETKISSILALLQPPSPPPPPPPVVKELSKPIAEIEQTTITICCKYHVKVDQGLHCLANESVDVRV